MQALGVLVLYWLLCVRPCRTWLSSNCRPSLLNDATTALAVPLVSFLLDWWLSNT